MLWSGMHLYVHFSPSLSLSMHFCVQNLRTILTVLRRLLRFSCYCSWLHLSHAENSCTLDNRIYTLTFIRERKMDWILNNLTSRENSSNSINLKEGEREKFTINWIKSTYTEQMRTYNISVSLHTKNQEKIIELN